MVPDLQLSHSLYSGPDRFIWGCCRGPVHGSQQSHHSPMLAADRAKQQQLFDSLL